MDIETAKKIAVILKRYPDQYAQLNRLDSHWICHSGRRRKVVSEQSEGLPPTNKLDTVSKLYNLLGANTVVWRKQGTL